MAKHPGAMWLMIVSGVVVMFFRCWWFSIIIDNALFHPRFMGAFFIARAGYPFSRGSFIKARR
jgi:hypothetical protein